MIAMRLLYRCFVIVLVTLCACEEAAAFEAGFTLEQFEDSNRERPILIDWWYPIDDQVTSRYNYGLGEGRAVEAAQMSEGTFPLVMLSHGAMGSARNYSWIAELLARNGYVVAGVSHFGESYVYGPETVDPAAVLRVWERPLDISAALSFVETDSVMSGSVDMQRVGFVGHSSGGATAMQLAGVTFDGSRIVEYCATSDSSEDRGCDYARAFSADSPIVGVPDVSTSFEEPRIRVYVALDPALGPGFVDYEKVDPGLAFLIVGSIENDFLPFEHHAQQIANGLAGPQTHWLADGEGHFVYLNECDLDLKANGVELCADREGVSRRSVHAALEVLVVEFFAATFEKVE